MLGYLRPYLVPFMVASVALILSAGLSLVFPWVIQEVVDTVLQEGDLEALNRITLALMVVFLLRSVASVVQGYLTNWIGERIVLDIRVELYQHLLVQSLKFYIDRRVGEIVSRISSDVTVMRTALTGNLSTLMQQSITMVGAALIMFVLNWRLTLFILALAPLVVLMGFAFGAIMRRISTEVQDELAAATVVAEEVMHNIREVKSFVREPFEIERYGQAMNRAFQAARRLLTVRAVFGPAVAFIAFAALSLILWFGGREVIEGRLTGGELIAFLIYGLTIAASFGGLVALYGQFQEAIGATKRVFQIMDATPEVQDPATPAALRADTGRVTFREVSFSYDGQVDVLNAVSLDVAPGEIVALVGPSGAGKSTMFNLIPRFYDATSGAVLINGVDVRTVPQHDLRALIGIVPQESLLFGGTIRENILYGRLEATEQELIDAARAANAHEFIEKLPAGYETIVGERGIRLSGGQRQRVAIARAILKNPRILLLDEATSSLDNESEYLVQEALGRLMAERTTIIIAHRLSTVRIAHRIAVMREGHLVELGTHDDLIAEGGLYARLYEMQFRDDTFTIEAEPAAV
jgi:ATP-binding cassette, subfamily B, bacterial MsbA